MSDERSYVAPWRKADEPAAAKHCKVCDCSEPENPAHHASTCPHYGPPEQIPGQTSLLGPER